MTGEPLSAAAHPAASADELHHFALQRAQQALLQAGLWPTGIQIVDAASGRFTLADTLRLLRAHDVTLTLDADLGAEARGLLLYPTRTIFMNARYYREVTTRVAMTSLVGVICNLFSLLLIHPPYSDALVMPQRIGPALTPQWPMWRTGVWLSIEMLLPSALVGETLQRSRRRRDSPLIQPSVDASMAVALSSVSGMRARPAGAYRRAITHLAETRQLMPEVVELKTLSVLRGLMDALAATHYTAEQRAAPLFPWSSPEMARALDAADFSQPVLTKIADALDAQIATMPKVTAPAIIRFPDLSSAPLSSASSAPRWPTRP